MKKSFRSVSSLAVAGSALLFGALNASASLLEVTDNLISNDNYTFIINSGPALSVYGGVISNAPALVARHEFFYRNEGDGKGKFMRAGSATETSYMVFGWDFSDTQYRPTQVTINAPSNVDHANPKVDWVYSWSATGLDGSWNQILTFQGKASYNLSEVVTLTGTPDQVYLKIELIKPEGRTVVADSMQWGRGTDATGIALSMDFDLVQIPESGTYALLGGVFAFAAVAFLRRRA